MRSVVREAAGILLAALALAVVSGLAWTPGRAVLKKAFGIHG